MICGLSTPLVKPFSQKPMKEISNLVFYSGTWELINLERRLWSQCATNDVDCENTAIIIRMFHFPSRPSFHSPS